MKTTLLFLFTIISLNVLSQEIVTDKIFISDSLTGESGKYYMEGKEIEINKTFLDYKNIEKVESFFGETAKERSGTSGSYLITRKNKIPLIELPKLIEQIKLENQSIKNIENVNIVINDMLIQNISEYKIEESCIVKIEVLINDKKGVNRNGTKPSIVIRTNSKDNSY